MTTRNGAELLVDTLHEHGVDRVFNLYGNGMEPLVEAVHSHDEVGYVGGVNETAVGLAAEGHARATREPSFLNVYHSSGTGLAMMAVTVAWGDRTPMIVTTTTNSRELERRDQYAAVPESITDVTDQYTKWSWEVPLAERIPEAIDRAVTIATTPPMGPVHLAFPMDIYDQSVAETDRVKRRERTGPVEPGPASGANVEDAAELLHDAERPLIAAGGEVGKHYAHGTLATLAELLDAAVVSEEGTSPYLPIATDDPHYRGEITYHTGLLDSADVVFAIGFEFTELTTDQFGFADLETPVIQFATTERDVGKQAVPDLSLLGHPRSTLQRLVERLRERGDRPRSDASPPNWVEEPDVTNADLLDALGGGDRPTPVEGVITNLRDAFGDDLVVVSHGVSARPYVQTLTFRDPDETYSISKKASAQGWGAGAAVGVQIANPDRDVVAVVGDGGFMFTGPNVLYTAVQQSVPVTIVVVNDLGWGGGGYEFELDSGATVALGTFDPPIEFAAMAESFGALGLRVDSPDRARDALERARAHDGPALIEVPHDPRGIERYRATRPT